MVRVPERDAVPEKGSVEKSTVALPVPAGFPTICRKGAFAVAVHAVVAVSVRAQAPPSLPIVTACGLTVWAGSLAAARNAPAAKRSIVESILALFLYF